MYDNINEINLEQSEKSHVAYEFKEEPIQLIYISDGILEPTTEAINLLTELRNEKLCIVSFNGPLSSGKSFLANNLINKDFSGFKSGEKTQGLWMWGTPIKLDNGSKLLILDCQGLKKGDEDNISFKLFMLNVLLSSCVVYTTQGELNDNIINDFFHFTDLSNKINVTTNKDDKLNNIDNLKEYFPNFIFVNNTLKKEEIQNLIENNPLCENFKKLFQNRDYFNNQDIQELTDKIKKELKYKSLDNNIIDGDAFFGLIQNYIDFMNDGDHPVIHSALENVLLSKAKNISEVVLEKFKADLTKKIKYPMSINAIYKEFFDLQIVYTNDFCKNVEKILTPTHTGEYIQKMYQTMEKELDTILETNKDYYDEWFGMEYQKIEENLGKMNLESIEEIKLFTLSYTNNFKNCLKDFLNIPNNDFCQNLINVLSKIFQNFVTDKLISIGDKINTIYENYSKECNSNIENLNNNIKKLTDQIDNNKKLLDDKNKEKSEVNKNYLELETKLEKLTRELKTKEQEFESNLNIEKQNFQKMETFNNTQIQEKDQLISTLEAKIEKLNQDNLSSNKESLMKVNELNRENIKLQGEIERLKKQDGKGRSDVFNEQSMNLQTLFKNIQSTFMEFKESVDKLDKENENIFKTKYLETSTNEMEEKLKNCVTDIRAFCDKNLKEMNEKYEAEIKKVKDKYDELNFEMAKKNTEIKEQVEKNVVNETKLKDAENKINELNEIAESKEGLVKTQNEAIKMYEMKIKDFQKSKEDLELSLAKNIYNFKMKEEEFDILFMVIEDILSKKKDKYEQNLGKLPQDVQDNLKAMVKRYKFFK